jgi:hypothetical protein
MVKARKNVSRVRTPNESLTGTLEEWEEAVFRNADLFAVIRYPSKQRTEHRTFAEAVAAAGDDQRALIYAVTAEGRYCCVPRHLWEQYLAPVVDSLGCYYKGLPDEDKDNKAERIIEKFGGVVVEYGFLFGNNERCIDAELPVGKGAVVAKALKKAGFKISFITEFGK